MFIAVELGGTEPRAFDETRSYTKLTGQLFKLEGTAQGREALQAIFGEVDDSFKILFTKVLEEEEVRHAEDDETFDGFRPVKPPSGHLLLYDVQSSFWVFLFGFAGVYPRQITLKDDTVSLDLFCEAMLGHVIGNGVAALRRSRYLGATHVRGLLHPQLSRLGKLLVVMTDYLSIPWHIYTDVPDDHATIAFQRLILSFLLESDAAFLDTRLDTERTRLAAVFDEVRRERIHSSMSSIATSNSQSASFLYRTSVNEEEAVQSNLSYAVSNDTRKRRHIDGPSAQVSNKRRKLTSSGAFCIPSAGATYYDDTERNVSL